MTLTTELDSHTTRVEFEQATFAARPPSATLHRPRIVWLARLFYVFGVLIGVTSGFGLARRGSADGWALVLVNALFVYVGVNSLICLARTFSPITLACDDTACTITAPLLLRKPLVVAHHQIAGLQLATADDQPPGFGVPPRLAPGSAYFSAPTRTRARAVLVLNASAPIAWLRLLPGDFARSRPSTASAIALAGTPRDDAGLAWIAAYVGRPAAPVPPVFVTKRPSLRIVRSVAIVAAVIALANVADGQLKAARTREFHRLAAGACVASFEPGESDHVTTVPCSSPHRVEVIGDDPEPLNSQGKPIFPWSGGCGSVLADRLGYDVIAAHGVQGVVYYPLPGSGIDANAVCGVYFDQPVRGHLVDIAPQYFERAS